jgi:anti-sigma factor RsiW
MSEPDNINDELLSAYLDNELAPDERARVDERLAADPAARQLLQQLRAVSHAVKQLPPAPLGTDLSESVLRRAERAMLTGERASARVSSLDEESPRFTIGRSVRGWVWAGLATAAALAIMAFESNSNRDGTLPDTVARREIKSADKEVTRGMLRRAPEPEAIAKTEQSTELSISALPPAPGVAAAPSVSDFAARSKLAAEQPATHGELDRRASSPANGRAMAVHQGIAGEARGGRAGGITAFDEAAAANKPSPDSGGTDANLLVVHLQVKPEAMQRHAFDSLLARNGIEIEDSPAAMNGPQEAEVERLKDAKPSRADAPKPSVAAANNPLPQLAAGTPPTSSAPAASLNDLSAATTSADVVLVEAPTSKIFSCLDEIHKDEHDYIGVAIDEDQLLAKEQSVDRGDSAWRQYNRGIVPQQEKDLRDANDKYYFSTNNGIMELNRGSTVGTISQQPGQEKLSDKSKANASNQRGRAMRMRSQVEAQASQQLEGNAQARQLNENLSRQSNENSALGFAKRGAQRAPEEQAASSADDTVQVMFVLRAGDEPATPPAAQTKAAK